MVYIYICVHVHLIFKEASCKSVSNSQYKYIKVCYCDQLSLERNYQIPRFRACYACTIKRFTYSMWACCCLGFIIKVFNDIFQ